MKVTTHKHSDKYGQRLALDFPYSADAKDRLKSELPFPMTKWESSMRAWSIKNEPSIIKQAADILTSFGMDCSEMYSMVEGVTVRDPNKAWVEARGKRLILHWPWIQDKILRDDVRLAVRAVTGRKWNADKKEWSIPIGQATTLYNLMEPIYLPLAQAIMECDAVSAEVDESINRVEMSGAVELKPVDAEELSQRLSAVLPAGLELYPFQKVGVAFAEASHGRCLIGDDMGVGKTIQALAYAALYPKERPLVIVSPANVKYNWKKEASKWLPNESVHVVDSGKASAFEPADIIIINYDLMNKQQDRLAQLSPAITVFDEIHYLKNSKAQRTAASIRVGRLSQKVIGLSGTAISSRPAEFFNSLNLLSSSQFPSEWDFKQRYCDPWHNGFGWDFKGASNTKELNERTRDMCIRRLKKEVLTELPDKVRQFIPIELSKSERKEYDDKQDEYYYTMDSHYAHEIPLPKGFMLNMLSDLRHICGRMKVPRAVEWIGSRYDLTDGKPLVVFCHHKDVLSGIADQLSAAKQYIPIRHDRIDGSVSSKRRQEIVESFQSGGLDVLLCNTIAAKEGITLTAADTVLFIEREWVPTDEEQAEDRVYRMGQESQSVHAVYLSVANSIDEHFDRVIEGKRQVVKAVLDGGDIEERQSLVKELVSRLRKQNGWQFETEEVI
jgi:SWI/SNF-related matrix-associated actin-dependent regulator 1 of chromatin subfamily A